VSSPPDPEYRLPPEIRARVAPDFDADALERLFQCLDATNRAAILDYFLLPEHRSTPHVRNQSFTLVGSSNGRINELLAEVWQPFWIDKPDEMLDDPESRYPGRELARERRRRQRAGGHR
jgi:hypothetical protein